MYISNKFLASSLLAIGMMSGSLINLAYAEEINNDATISADAQNQEVLSEAEQGQEEQDQNQEQNQQNQQGETLTDEMLNSEEEDVAQETGGSGGSAEEWESMYSTSSSSSSYDSGFEEGQDGSDLIDDMNGSVENDNTETIGEGTSSGPGEGGPIVLGYPSFSAEEINELFNVSVYEDDENALDVEPPEGVEEGELVFLENATQLHRHLPPDPVYSYGKDSKGKGVCTGTADFCEESEKMWAAFGEKIKNDETITYTEDNEKNQYNKNQISMPKDYLDSYKEMPTVSAEKEASCTLPLYTPYVDGNQYEPTPHCGKMGVANNYHVLPIVWN